MTMQDPQHNEGLTESDILPLQHEDRTADSPMGAVLGFLGLAAAAELTTSAFEAVGGMEGGLTVSGLSEMGQDMAPAVAPDNSFNVEFDPLAGPAAPKGLG